MVTTSPTASPFSLVTTFNSPVHHVQLGLFSQAEGQRKLTLIPNLILRLTERKLTLIPRILTIS
jgi:hypothetical protein